MRTNRIETSVGLWLVLSFLISAPVLADDFPCTPDFGAETVDGNILIADACHLDGTTVKGNVILFAGGSLTAINARIDGNIQADTANFIEVENTLVNGGVQGVLGDVQLDAMVGDLSYVRDSTIQGSIQLKANRSRLELQRNFVGGDLQAFDNTGGVLIESNIIDGNLQCKSNSPEPVGADNQVAGNKEDQCANLAPESAGDSAGASTAASSGTSGGGALAPFFLVSLLALGLLRELRNRSYPPSQDWPRDPVQRPKDQVA